MTNHVSVYIKLIPAICMRIPPVFFFPVSLAVVDFSSFILPTDIDTLCFFFALFILFITSEQKIFKDPHAYTS